MSYAVTTNGKIAKGQDVNEWKTVSLGGHTFYVHKYAILGTTIVDYAVYELDLPNTNGRQAHGHHTFTYSDVGHGIQCLGDITTRDIPAEVEALRPGTDERIAAVTAWYDGCKAIAKAIVLIAYPSDF